MGWASLLGIGYHPPRLDSLLERERERDREGGNDLELNWLIALMNIPLPNMRSGLRSL
jgi:hypothetical protein